MGPLWTLPAFGLLLIAAVWVATLLHLRSTERGLIDEAMRDTETFVASFEQYTRRAIKDIDRMARIVKEEFQHHGVVDLPKLIHHGLIDGGGIVVLSVANAKGEIIARSQPYTPFNIADRDFFKVHASHDTGSIDFSKPVLSRVTGLTMVLLSRRMNHADGSFAGVVILSMTPEYFVAFYGDAQLGKRGRLGLLGLDGTYRARRMGEETNLDADDSAQQLLARVETKRVGQFEERDSLDQVRRLVAYRKLADYPLVVTAARAVDEALAEFYRTRSTYLIIASTATAVILIFFAVVTALALRLQRQRAELKDQRRFLETLVDLVPSGITVRSMLPRNFGQYVLCNESNALIFGTGNDSAIGRTVRDTMAPEYAAEIIALDRQLLESPMVQEIVQVLELPHGAQRILHLIRMPMFDAQGRVEAIMSSATDITKDRARTQELELAAKVFETTADAIMICDSKDRVVKVNAAFSRLTGYDAADILGKVLADTPFRPLDPVQSAARYKDLQKNGYMNSEVARFRKDGSPLALWLSASCMRNDDGTIRNFVRIFTDISLLKETQQKLEQLASFDALTGLPNRRLLHDRLEQATRRAQRGSHQMAVMFIDLDGLKEVNDTHGHDVGDLLLTQVATRLRKCIRLSDSIGRLGGDEFAIVLEDPQHPIDAVRVAERIVDALAPPFFLSGKSVCATASLGIAIYPNDGTDATALLKNADVAMYRAKEAGRNAFRFFSQAEDVSLAIGAKAAVE